MAVRGNLRGHHVGANVVTHKLRFIHNLVFYTHLCMFMHALAVLMNSFLVRTKKDLLYGASPGLRPGLPRETPLITRD